MAKFFQKEKLKNDLTAFFVMFITAILLIVSSTYIMDLKKNLMKESQEYLIEISEHIRVLVDFGLNNIEKDATTIKKSVEKNFDIEDIDSFLPYLDDIAQDRDFLRICIADTNGNYYASDGYDHHISDSKIYDKIIHGETHFITYEAPDTENESTIIYGVPLVKDGEVKAAMFISNNNLHLSDSLDIQSFGNEGYSIIISENGDYVFRSQNKNSVPAIDNFFDIEVQDEKEEQAMLSMKENLKNHDSGFIEYTSVYNGVKKSANYRPINIEGWYLVTIIPSVVMERNMNIFITYSTIIVFIIICLFMAVIYMLYHNQKKSRKSLEKIAYVDPVTNGRNDNCFAKDALSFIKEKPENYYSMISIDIKNFKVVNTTYGSRAGNQLLAYVYNFISKQLYEDELIARVHGDVFNILMRYTNEEEVTKRLKEMIHNLNKFNESNKDKYYLYFLTGIYVIDIPDMSMIMIQDRANVARKSVKEKDVSDLNTCVFYRDLERQRLLREKDIENRMEEALANDEFKIYLHPKFDLQKNEITGAEALIRWLDPNHGLLLPQDFLPVFEKNSFILKTDLFVFSKTCDVLENWYTNGKKMVQISVNVSKLHMINPKFLDEYIDIFEKYSFPAQYIRFELTETILCDNLELLKDIVKQMHTYGFTMSLDDFGSGYSSLNLLKDIEADELKLDRDFFTSGSIDERNSCIIESIIDLAKKLHMDTVCEGIENQQQLEHLKELHCDMVQSFLLYLPLPTQEFEDLINKKDNDNDTKA